MGGTNAPQSGAQFKGAILSVADMESGCGFYAEVFGLRPRFRDGDKWAALDAPGGLSLAGQDERLPDRVALSFKVPDVEAALDRAVAAGATVVAPVTTGGHERKAMVRDPDGHLVVLYSPAA